MVQADKSCAKTRSEPAYTTPLPFLEGILNTDEQGVDSVFVKIPGLIGIVGTVNPDSVGM